MNVFVPGTRFLDEQIRDAQKYVILRVISSVTGFSFEKCGSEWKCKEHDSLRV
ncbi:hypothetical protein [Ruminococcus sp.]|uniref:hypothetical protein n=1 Tax=Ruminococcus sp. TaxID=41978 RepID=UPI00399F4575